MIYVESAIYPSCALLHLDGTAETLRAARMPSQWLETRIAACRRIALAHAEIAPCVLDSGVVTVIARK
jgi:hypothetical protein